MTAPNNEPALYVLSLAAVKAGIFTLQRQQIHEHFPGYLYLRKVAIEKGELDHLEPDWGELGKLLRMPGGPPNKPYYRPFASRKVQDPGRYWLNRNLAGSYALKSLREKMRFVVSGDGTEFALPTNHAEQALETLLRGQRIPAWAMAAFMLRNYGFRYIEEPGFDQLLQAFRHEFLLHGTEDFNVLFSDVRPEPQPDPWFELYRPSGRTDEREHDG